MAAGWVTGLTRDADDANDANDEGLINDANDANDANAGDAECGWLRQAAGSDRLAQRPDQGC